MKDAEIKERFEKLDKDQKMYIDLKFKASNNRAVQYIDDEINDVKKQVSIFIWMRKHLFWTSLIALVILSGLIGVSHRISIKQLIKATTGIEINENIHE